MPDELPHHDADEMPPALRWGVAVGLLVVGILFFIVSAFDMTLFGAEVDLFKEGWAFTGVSIFIMFGLRLGDFFGGPSARNRDD